MTDQESAETTQEGQETTTTVTQTTDATLTQDAGEEFDKERALATIKKLREFEKAGKAAQKELDQLRAAQKASEDAKLSESERMTNRLAELERSVAEQKADAEQKIADAEAKRLELETELASERRARQVAQVAATLGAHDPHDANILSATSGIDIADAKAGEKIKTALDTLKASKPYLFKTAGTRVEPFNPGAATGAARTDQEVVNDLRSQSQSGKTPFG